jgi:hypothetical protein
MPLTKVYCTSDLKKKRTLTVYQNVGQYILIGDTGMAVCFVDYYAVWRSDRPWVFFTA